MENALILNVDDNDAGRYAKTRILTRAGFEVVEAASGSEAIARSRSERPRLVLLDVKLPDINGFEVCRRLKEDPSTKNILVLQTSASFVAVADRIRALDGGADNYLVEPIEPEALVANVKALVRLGNAESLLRESERRFRQIAENVSDVFWIFSSQENRLLYVSPAYEALWGRSATTLLSNVNDWLEAVHPQDRGRVAGAFASLRASGRYEEEYRVVHPDGSIRWIRDRGFPVRVEEGEDNRVARISQDITEKKNAVEQLKEAGRRKDEFLATLAHELRNPLGPIKNSVELMQHVAPQPGEIEQRARGVILRQTDHLVRLVDDLLDISRITRGKINLRKEPVALQTFVRSAVETVQGLVEARQHGLNIRLPEKDVWVLGDSTRLAQVIGNLLHNAAKFTPMGGEIRLTAVSEGTELVIAVEDNGIGIDPSRSEDIFDLFTQADHAPDRPQDGLGVGLSLVRKLVELHGGTVRVESPGIGQGSRFEIVLPVLVQHDSPAPLVPMQGDGSARSERQPRRVLLVDDNVDAANTLAALIENDGHACMTLYDGREAVAAALRFSPDIVILDIGLPGLSGYDVAKDLRKQPALHGATLVALTGFGQPRDQQHAADAGFDHHFVKPIGMEALAGLGLAPAALAPAKS